jgi:hypothetical protein
MDVNVLLSRLDGVKGRNGSWVARCPAHEDRSPSLAVKELDDGRILLHCFAGCGTDAVLGVLGLTLADLFEKPLTQERLAPVRAFTALDALLCLRYEGGILALTAADLSEGIPVDMDRLTTSCQRITEALELVHGNR